MGVHVIAGGGYLVIAVGGCMNSDEAAVGSVGVLSVATRGTDGPGEVMIKVRGGTESFLAWSDEPLARGRSVLVIATLGARQVTVVAWTDGV
jgi:hypothetical protein